ncbi:DUF6318 family protein [Cellulosimicrobium cellulans]|uniref:DUF6318 domain-containing protein n=1 Tax=Cellulosimicrobium cellulans TaxID=1710 RepID=A0A4Y4DY87_CELCE|nr:DUF6318 family protein [Cellulosimicrobium cellulans]GED08525.1 hypothetical protein CCE02nite_05240 [Cellulosimicrobium cellulans]
MGAVVAVGWLAAGCTGGGDPGPSPSVEEPVVPSPSETPEPSPTETGPVKPERPAAMERDDAEGAAAAAEYFLSLYGYVLATGDIAEWDAMTWSETCEFCANVRADAESIAAAGDKYEGAEITVANPDVDFDDFANGYAILFDFQQSPHRRIASDGSVVSEDNGGAGRLQIDVSVATGDWLVLAVTSAE